MYSLVPMRIGRLGRRYVATVPTVPVRAVLEGSTRRAVHLYGAEWRPGCALTATSVYQKEDERSESGPDAKCGLEQCRKTRT